MKLILLFVILVSSPLAFSQTEAQVRVLDKKVKSFFKKTTSTSTANPKCQYAKELFELLSKVVVRDLGNSDYDITGDLPTLPHVWIELRSGDNTCKSSYFDSHISLPESLTTYIQTSKEKPVRTLSEDVTHFFKNALKRGEGGNKRCSDAKELYNDLKNVKIRDLGDLNLFITGVIGGDAVFVELEHSDGYSCDYGDLVEIDPVTNKPKTKPKPQFPRERVCRDIPHCPTSGYNMGQCGTIRVCE